MLIRSDSVRRLGVLLLLSIVSGCVVQPPQPVPPPKAPPPVTPAPPSAPPVVVPPAPKTYTGTYAERLEAVMRDTLAGTPVRVQRSASIIKLVIPANAAFAANSAQLQTRFSAVLDNVARVCREYSKTGITVKGFTDSTGSFEHNQQLSTQRAQTVGAYLGRDIAATRIQSVGYGPRNPIADNKTDAGRSQNRRIEIELAVTP